MGSRCPPPGDASRMPSSKRGSGRAVAKGKPDLQGERHSVVVHNGLPSPFPFVTPKGKTIIDELCRCNHLRSKHHDSPAYGHGECSDPECPCDKYTWASMVYAR